MSAHLDELEAMLQEGSSRYLTEEDIPRLARIKAGTSWLLGLVREARKLMNWSGYRDDWDELREAWLARLEQGPLNGPTGDLHQATKPEGT